MALYLRGVKLPYLSAEASVMTTGVTLREASSSDMQEIRSFLEGVSERASLGLPLEFTDRERFVYAALRDGELVGFSVFNFIHGDVTPLFVFPPYRRQGIGRAVVGLLIDILRNSNNQRLFFRVVDEHSGGFWSAVLADHDPQHYDDNRWYIRLAPDADQHD
ncbi:GNAT family N-acetyltransferase [Pseudomonas sp. 3A(2025)]